MSPTIVIDSKPSLNHEKIGKINLEGIETQNLFNNLGIFTAIVLFPNDKGIEEGIKYFCVLLK